ncbi:alpha/beta fold hydrolase [Fluviicola taffensis]|uniref:Alpha/beta hydrolase fold protein n=1 Tax=Fluviicola taffensis (strain DSM 16823 / NCIMB 13979 / RW262) TaxID=755732 RepID=F2IJD5_FLUTR|nr:alpha/beta hydrolase [Fluviicola taffensis]AEA46032.1 alpha/beta hydrolase fold protein [Fluviicola taffensis DSM 16823]
MIKQTSGFTDKITNSGTEQAIFHTIFQSEEKPLKATILILHGMQEHSGRYIEFANFLAESGYAVLTYDHAGHGKTAASKSHHGYFHSNNAAKRVVDDAEKMAELLEQEFPSIPHFVLGHSMGSFITRCLLQQAHHRFDGAIIVGTGGKQAIAPIARFVFSILNTLTPQKRSIKLNRFFNNLNNKRFKGDSSETRWLSVNKENQRAFVKDELCGIPFTNNGFHTLLTLNIKSTRNDWASNISKKLPFLFVSGAEDPIGDFSKGVTKTVENMKKEGFSNTSLLLYPKMRHEILNEDIKHQVFQDIQNWLDERLV